MIYWFYMTYMICHEFWVPVRPTQNCAGVIMLFLHVITVLRYLYRIRLKAMLCHVMLIYVL